MLLVVVELAGLDEIGQILGDLGILAVPLDQIHDMVRDHRREPPRLLTGIGDVVGDVTGRTDDALQLARVAACIVAYQLAAIVGSRMPGFVTKWPSLILLVRAAASGSVA